MSDSSSDEGFGPTSGTETTDENYQKYELREHVLKRPENYIGTTQSHTQEMWVVENDKLVLKNITYVPGLYKIFDEILVNAADNCQRSPPTKNIKVEINQEEGFISIWNDGKGIPITEKYDEKDDTKYWIPEFIFGHLLTSSNYDDSQKRTTGGRNGFGAKLANIYSTLFLVECYSINPDNDKFYKYEQKFSDHMENIEKPKIQEIKGRKKASSTLIKFYPDCSLFGMTKLDDDIINLLKKRVWDMAGVLKNCKVFLNGTEVPIKGFENYCKKYLENDPNAEFFSCDIGDRWKIGVSASDGTFNQVSFVNSVATTRGGTHVECIAGQITRYICKELEKARGNKIVVKSNVAKSYLFVFVNCLIENPSFDSQTKETLTLRSNSFGSKCEVPETLLKKIMKSNIPNLIREFAKFKENGNLKKMGGRKTARIHGMAKLVDANEAGKKKSSQCTLILTEGDSAKSMAVTGLSVIGRDLFGVFPLRGKMLNTRDISPQKLQKNEEIQNLMKIMALKPGMKYNDNEALNDLRYGKIMIMTDQDQDGSHIKGLIINFIHSMWPELIKRSDFLYEFVTPIVKASKGKEKVVFYTLPEFIEWKKSHNDAKGYVVKYYKGLATSSDEETKEYFSDIKRHKIMFEFSGETDEERIQLAFSKKRADDRKNWLAGLDPDTTYLGQDTPTITYSDFVDKELILFSNYANVRAIPSVIDGLKPGQRKILWVSLKINLKKEIKVNQLGAKVSEQSAYHHGEDSLSQTIIAMAQTFVGSNNINVFYPSGQFGTRLRGGEDAGSPRYIFTRLMNITRSIFHKDDDQLLEYLTDEGIPIEPKFYVPVIPMVLVNGSNGIGVGWSSTVPSYNPLDIIKNIRHKIYQEEMEEMTPWYSGYTGEIKKLGPDNEKAKKWNVAGRAKIISNEMIEISELPLQVWTDDYKQFLDNLFTGESEKEKEKKKGTKKSDDDRQQSKFEPKISDVKEYHTNETVQFEVYCNSEQMDNIKSVGLDKFFRLTKTISATNMTLFAPDGRIKQYLSAEEIIDDFFPVRVKLYDERKAAILEDLGTICTRLTNQARFIKEFIDGLLELRNIPRKQILQNLKIRKYELMDMKKKLPKKVAEDAVAQDDGNEEEEAGELISGKKSQQAVKSDPETDALSNGYDYLLSMKIWTMTRERYLKLLQQKEEAEHQIEAMMKKQPTEMWLDDLNALEKEYNAFTKEREQKRASNMADAEKSRKKSKSKVQFVKIKAKQADSKKQKAPKKKARPGDSRADVDSQADENQPNGKKAAMSPGKKKVVAAQRKPRAKKEDAAAPTKKAPVVKKKAPLKKTENDDDIVDDDVDGIEELKTRPAPAIKKDINLSTKSSSKQQTKSPFDDSDNSLSGDDDDDDDDDDDEIAPSSMIVQERTPRNVSKVKKSSSDGENDDDDDDNIESSSDSFEEED